MQPTSHTGTAAPGSFSAQGLWAPLLRFCHPFSHLPGCSSPWAMSCDPRVAVGWQLYPLLRPLGRCPPPFPLMEKGLLIYFPCYYSEDSQRYKSADSPCFGQMKTVTTITLCYLHFLLRSRPSDFTPLLAALSQPVWLAELLPVGPTRGPNAMGQMEKIPSVSMGPWSEREEQWAPAPLGWHKQPNLRAISSAPTSFR